VVLSGKPSGLMVLKKFLTGAGVGSWATGLELLWEVAPSMDSTEGVGETFMPEIRQRG